MRKIFKVGLVAAGLIECAALVYYVSNEAGRTNQSFRYPFESEEGTSDNHSGVRDPFESVKDLNRPFGDHQSESSPQDRYRLFGRESV